MSEHCKAPSPLPASVSGLIWKDNAVTVQALPRPLSFVLGAGRLVANQKSFRLSIVLEYHGPSELEKTSNRTLDLLVLEGASCGTTGNWGRSPGGSSVDYTWLVLDGSSVRAQNDSFRMSLRQSHGT